MSTINTKLFELTNKYYLCVQQDSNSEPLVLDVNTILKRRLNVLILKVRSWNPAGHINTFQLDNSIF